MIILFTLSCLTQSSEKYEAASALQMEALSDLPKTTKLENGSWGLQDYVFMV